MIAPGGLWYMVEGINPQPWEASEGQVVGRRKVVFHKTDQLRFYQLALGVSFTDQNPRYVALKTGIPLKVLFLFWREIEVVEKTGGGTSRSNIADATNLQKAAEDALQNVLYGNDQKNVDVRSRIVEQDVGVSPRIMIYISPDPGLSDFEASTVAEQFDRLHKDLPAGPSNILANSNDDLF